MSASRLSRSVGRSVGWLVGWLVGTECVMKIDRFEDLECWKEARKLTRMVYEVAQHCSVSRDSRLRDQITGASISVMNNIAEGFGSMLNSEFKRFLLYARRSVSETQNCLYIASDQNYITTDDFNRIYVQAESTRKLIDGMLRYLRSMHSSPKTSTKPTKPT